MNTYMRGLKKMATNYGKNVAGGAKIVGKGIKKVGKVLDKKFIEPSRNLNRIQKQKDDEMRRKAEAGEYN
jgi:hypothetical protein